MFPKAIFAGEKSGSHIPGNSAILGKNNLRVFRLVKDRVLFLNKNIKNLNSGETKITDLTIAYSTVVISNAKFF